MLSTKTYYSKGQPEKIFEENCPDPPEFSTLKLPEPSCDLTGINYLDDI